MVGQGSPRTGVFGISPAARGDARRPVDYRQECRHYRQKPLRRGEASLSFCNAFDLAGASRAGLIPQRGSQDGPSSGLVAQSVEQRPFKPLVLGSSPSQPTTLKTALLAPKLWSVNAARSAK